MFVQLFLKECKQILKSMVFWVFILLFLLDIATQMSSSEIMDSFNEPQAGQQYYGEKETTDIDLTISQTIKLLGEGVSIGHFSTYPIGFYKSVTPSEEELAQLDGIVKRATGKSASEFEYYYEYAVPILDSYTFEEFQNDMRTVCDILGKGSYFEEESYISSAVEPATYEDAMHDYVELRDKDKFTKALMRLYCDYAGVTLALLVVFVGVSAALRDKRAKAYEVINAKSISSVKLLFIRFLANVVMIYIPVIITAFVIELPYVYLVHNNNLQVDFFAFISIPTVWLLPQIMVVLATSFILTDLVGGIISIVIQIFWAMYSLFTSAEVTLAGNFQNHLIVRWNIIGGATDFANQQKDFLMNRGMYFSLSIVFLILAYCVYEWKRRNGGTLPWERK